MGADAGRWTRPYFTPSPQRKDRAWIDLVVFTHDRPALDVDLDEEDGFPPGFEFPRSLSARSVAIDEHRDMFESYLEGAFRDLAGEQLGEASAALDRARYGVVVEGSIPDPPDLAHLQAIRALARYFARTAGGIAIANDLSLSWQDLRPMSNAEPPPLLRVDEWVEVLYDDEVGALHTRGMAQFARPDITVFDQPHHRLERASQLLRHVAHLEAHGARFEGRAMLEVEGFDSSSPRVTIALNPLESARCKALAVAEGALVVEGWPSGIA
jgi:hypothetical protein